MELIREERIYLTLRCEIIDIISSEHLTKAVGVSMSSLRESVSVLSMIGVLRSRSKGMIYTGCPQKRIFIFHLFTTYVDTYVCFHLFTFSLNAFICLHFWRKIIFNKSTVLIITYKWSYNDWVSISFLHSHFAWRISIIRSKYV